MIDPKQFNPGADPQDGHYVYSDPLRLAIRVALATARPLLLRGAPGSGKTTLARDVARQLTADYYQEVVTSRTEARDLQWRFDSVLRLAESQLDGRRQRVATAANYVEPRGLWWAFDPKGARARGGADSDAADPLNGGSDADRPAVMLIDEIDKAEPEVANDLLEPFDVGTFRVAETGTEVSRQREVFVVVTTNEERDLPAAFLRRCVVFEIQRPPRETLLRIARSHSLASNEAMVHAMIDLVDQLVVEANAAQLRAPGTAEFLDALRACAKLDVAANGDEWKAISRLAMWKHRPAREEQA